MGLRREHRRWTPILGAILIAAAAAAGPPGGAQPSDDLYQATVIVTGTDTRSRPIGFAQALRNVLVNVTGEPRLRND
ncbi:MAG: DUF2066 domain-containing protein, partial [bacterium]